MTFYLLSNVFFCGSNHMDHKFLQQIPITIIIQGVKICLTAWRTELNIALSNQNVPKQLAYYILPL